MMLVPIPSALVSIDVIEHIPPHFAGNFYNQNKFSQARILPNDICGWLLDIGVILTELSVVLTK